MELALIRHGRPERVEHEDGTAADELAELDRGHTFYVPVEELRETGDPRYEQLLRGELYGRSISRRSRRSRRWRCGG